MQNSTIEQSLSRWARERLAQVYPGVDVSSIRPDVVGATDEKFGDFQCNVAMAIGKMLKKSPREIAQAIVDGATLPESVARLEIAGPGFINIWLNDQWLARHLESLQRDESLGTPAVEKGRTLILDYSGPNIAKSMHVGHIRSIVIGNALDRMRRFLGAEVVADNHLGDWGTQFGILILGWKAGLNAVALRTDPTLEMERIYKNTNAACQADPEKLDQAKQELVKLQGGDAENLRIWSQMLDLSRAHFEAIYARLGVRFDQVLGESFYNERLAGVVKDLLAKGIARESEGAIAVFSDGRCPPGEDPFLIHKDGEWKPNPCLVRKGDGGFNYATSDLATLAYRMETWKPGDIVYVTDGRQQLHFRQIFAIFRRWFPDAAVDLAHIWFGTILGADGKPFKTRSGDTVKLEDLLNEAEERALAIVTEKSPDMDEAQRRSISRMVGIGALKYADLMSNRQNDYVFSWEKMLTLEGNTAPYLQYACARIASVQDKYAELFPSRNPADLPIVLVAPLERRLAVRVTRFPDTLIRAAQSHRPNVLCDYLFDLAQVYSAFYQNVPFLKAVEGVRESRVRLCDIVARTLRTGLGLLGIETPARI